MSQCDKLDNIIDDVIEGIDQNERQIQQRMDDTIGSTPETKKNRSLWDRIINRGTDYGKDYTEQMDNAAFLKLYEGPSGERALIAIKIKELLAQSDIRSFVFMEYIKKDMLKLGNFGQIEMVDGKPVLESLPYQYLKELHEKLWNFGTEKDWDKAIYRRWKISHGRPFNLKYNDSSGGYAIMEDSVSQYAGAVWRDIQQFMEPNGKRFTKDGKPYGMNEVYRWAGEIIDLLDPDTLQMVKDKKGGTAGAKAYMIQFLTMYLNGWISQDMMTGEFYIASQYTSIDKQQKGDTDHWRNTYDRAVRYKGQSGRVVEELEGGQYTIALDNGKIVKNVNESDLTISMKSYIFTWDNFILAEEYNEAIHGAAFTERYEHKMPPLVMDFLKAYVPLNPEAQKRMNELFVMVKGSKDGKGRENFRGIHQETYTWFNGVRDNNGKLALDKKGNEVYIGAMEESKRKINEAVMKWFIKPDGSAYDSRLVEQALRSLWEVDYEAGPDVPQHLMDIVGELDVFTEFVMFESLFWDTLTMEEKDSFPIQFVMKKLTFQFDRFENRMLKQKARLEQDLNNATSDKRSIRQQIEVTDSRIQHAKWAKGRAAMLPEDTLLNKKILARKDSVHAKHITNAFDPMEMRVDSDVYETYLTNQASTVQRNNMNAALIDAIRIIRRDKKLNPQAVEDAVMSLYQGTIGHPDTRGMFGGVDVSPNALRKKLEKIHINVPSSVIEMNFKTMNRWLTGMLLNSFLTAAGNATQFVEKGMVFGHKVLFEMADYYSEYKNDAGLQELLRKADVTAFTDYFSQNMIGELEALEGGRAQVMPTVAAMIKYRNDVESGKNEEKAFQKMKREVLKHLRVEIERGDVPIITELTQRHKALKRENRLERANKMANWAITKDFKGAEPQGRFKKFKASFNRSARFISQFQKDMAGLPTMAGTEGTTRSISWLIGAELHRRLMKYQLPLYELMPSINSLEQQLIKGAKLTAEERSSLKKQLKELKRQLQEYLVIGKYATRALDFDLEKALYSESSRTSSGKWGGLFGDFGKQQGEQQGNKWIAAYQANKRIGSLGKQGGKLDPIYTTFKTLQDLGKGVVPEWLWKIINAGYVPKETRQALNPASATLQRMGSIWAFTVAYNMVVGFGGSLILSPLTNAILRKVTGSHKLGTFKSDLASLLISLPLSLAYHVIWPDDEEEDDWDELWQDVMFSVPIIGVGGGQIAHAMMALWGMKSGDVEAIWDDGAKPIIQTHSPKILHPVLDEAEEKVKEYF